MVKVYTCPFLLGKAEGEIGSKTYTGEYILYWVGPHFAGCQILGKDKEKVLEKLQLLTLMGTGLPSSKKEIEETKKSIQCFSHSDFEKILVAVDGKMEERFREFKTDGLSKSSIQRNEQADKWATEKLEEYDRFWNAVEKEKVQLSLAYPKLQPDLVQWEKQVPEFLASPEADRIYGELEKGVDEKDREKLIDMRHNPKNKEQFKKLESSLWSSGDISTIEFAFTCLSCKQDFSLKTCDPWEKEIINNNELFSGVLCKSCRKHTYFVKKNQGILRGIKGIFKRK